jgi:hypothetical protein
MRLLPFGHNDNEIEKFLLFGSNDEKKEPEIDN